MSGLISRDCSGSRSTLVWSCFQTYQLSLGQKQKKRFGDSGSARRLIINSRTHTHTPNADAEQHPSLSEWRNNSARTVKTGKKKPCHTHSLSSRAEPLPGRERQVSHGDVAAAPWSFSPCGHSVRHTTARHSTAPHWLLPLLLRRVREVHHRHPVEDKWRDSFHSRQPERLVIYSYFRGRFLLFFFFLREFDDLLKIGTYIG